MLLFACLLAGALLLRLDGITQPSLSARELHNALLARRYYLGAGSGLPLWKQRVLAELRHTVQPIEPPVLPILALACAALAGFVLDHLDTPRVATLSATSLLVLIVGVGAYKSRPSGADTAAIAAYRRIGAVTHHTTHAIIVDERLRAPAMYHGWIAGHYWYPPTPGQDLPAAGDPFPPWIEPAQASYLVIVDVSELRSERRLRAFVRDLPVVADTSRYAVFALGGGRAVAAAERTGRQG